MKRLIPVSAALALLLGGIAPVAVQAGTITYDIVNYPAEQSGHTLSGLIITDGKIGALAASDILSWTVTIDAGTPNAFTKSGTGSSSAKVTGDVEASGSQITLAQPAPGAINDFDLIDGPFDLDWTRASTHVGFHDNRYSAVNTSPASVFWSNNPGDTLGGDPWVIAETPEPASLTLMSVGGVALLGYGWRRRRRTAE